MKKSGIYIHIPFCKRKCLYCDFPSFDGCENLFEDYVNSLVLEMKETSIDCSSNMTSIFIGGGTPTVLPPKLLGKIMDTVLSRFNVDSNAEITIESNPGTVNRQYFKELKSMDINRISFGVQAWQDSLLKTLGRIHDKDTFVENFYQAREEGFKNINCDLMFSLPNQTLSHWEETLEKTIKLNPEHISAYGLIIEDGTKFKDYFDKGIYEPTDESLDRQMYYLAKEILKDKGYKQYEISNFAKENYESVHNILYWRVKEYYGFGLGAHSYIDSKRYHNTYDLASYIGAKGNIKSLREDVQVLSLEEKMEEFMFMGLRMTKGIHIDEFKKKFKTDFFSIYKNEAEYLLEKNLLTIKGNQIALTEKGIDISNRVFEMFIKN